MENIYIQWHFTTHGIAFFKHILSAFYSGKCSLKQKKILSIDLKQEDMNVAFNSSIEKGFVFDKVYYFTANKDVFDKIVTYNLFNKGKFYIEDELLIEKELSKEWQDVISKNLSIEDEFLYIKNRYPDKAEQMWELIWRNIQHYPIEEQKWWFLTQSNANIYKDKIEFINMTEKEKINNLTDYEMLADAMKSQLSKIFAKHKDTNFLINPVLCSREIQIVWFSLAAANFFPASVKFIQTYDRKDKYPDKRFKLFDIKEIPTNIVSQIRDNISYFEFPQSQSRKLADAKMQQYIKSGFAIFLLGERGIGKTHLAEKYRSDEQNFVSVNCASFTNSDIAESILFGYKKGAFTDAKTDREGVFEQANNGILFFDEIHHLDKLTQAKLMKAIQTDEQNFFTIKRLGDNKERKVQTTLIFASNRSIEELREVLLPDFFDRITQLVIEIPALRESKADLVNDMKVIWKQMRFDEFFMYDDFVKNDKKLFDWLKTLPLYGNYRDLQKISIYYKTFLLFDNETKKMLKEKSAFEFTKNQFEKYISFSQTDDLFDLSKHPQELVKNYQKIIAKKYIEEYGNAKNIEEKFNISSRTIYSWKNGK